MQFHRTIHSPPALVNTRTGQKITTNISGRRKPIYNNAYTGMANAKQRQLKYGQSFLLKKQLDSLKRNLRNSNQSQSAAASHPLLQQSQFDLRPFQKPDHPTIIKVKPDEYVGKSHVLLLDKSLLDSEEPLREYTEFKSQRDSLLVVTKYTSIKSPQQSFLEKSYSSGGLQPSPKACEKLKLALDPPTVEHDDEVLTYRRPNPSLRSLQMSRDCELVRELYRRESELKKSHRSSVCLEKTKFSYPLSGSCSFQQLGLNRVPLKLAKRTMQDFDPLQKLSILPTPEPKPAVKKDRTKNRFPEEAHSVIKSPAVLARQSYTDLIKQNPSLKRQIINKEKLDIKRISISHESRKVGEQIIKKKCRLNEAEFVAQIRGQLIDTFLKNSQVRVCRYK